MQTISIPTYQYSLSPRRAMIVTRVAYGFAACLLAALVYENFLLSSGFDILSFRELNDVAFHATLKRVHQDMSQGNWGKLFFINDYGYGWAFWFPVALITYPLYLISGQFGIDWPLIMAPRQLSLAFGVLTLVVLRKMVLKRHQPEWVAAVAVLIYLLFPTFGYASLHFGTTSQVFFFTILSIYLALTNSPSSTQGRLQIAAALSFAGGVKLTGLLVGPLIFFLVLFQYKYTTLKQFAFDFLVVLTAFVLLLIVFTNPGLLIYPFDPSVAHEYFRTLSHFYEVTQRGDISFDRPFNRFYDIFFNGLPTLIALSLLGVGLVAPVFGKKEGWQELGVIAGLTAFIMGYLFLTVSNGRSGALYFSAISFVLLLGTIWWSQQRMGVPVLASMAVLLLADMLHNAWLQHKIDRYSFNHLAYFVIDNKSKAALELSEKVSDCMEVDTGVWSGHVFIDYRVQTSFNSLSAPKACISVAFDNLAGSAKYCQRPIDFVVIHKKSPGSLSQADFDTKLKTMDPRSASELVDDRNARANLARGGPFDGRNFKLLCDLGDAAVYQAEEAK